MRLAVVVLVNLALAWTASAATAYVGSGAAPAGAAPVTLVEALRDSSADVVVVTSDYDLGGELDAYDRRPLNITRNLTITGADGTKTKLDLGFKRARLWLCDTCRLVWRNITVANERRGNGPQFDLILGPGRDAAVETHDTVRLRLACTPPEVFGHLIDQTPRSHMYPGRQQWRIVNFPYNGRVYDGQANPQDYSLDNPLVLLEGKGLTGGYSQLIKNTTRLCLSFVAYSCLEESSADACVNEAIDRALRGGGGGGGGGGGLGAGALAAAVAVPVAVLAVALAASIWLLCRRRRRQQQGRDAALAHTSTDIEAIHSKSSGRLTVPAKSSAGVQESFVTKTGNGWRVVATLTSPDLEGKVPPDAEVELGELIGSGSYGRVYHARWAGRDVAVKAMRYTPGASQAVEHEARLLLQQAHPNVVRAFRCIFLEREEAGGGAGSAGCGSGGPRGSGSKSSGGAPVGSGGEQRPSASGISGSGSRGGGGDGGTVPLALQQLQQLRQMQQQGEPGGEAPAASPPARRSEEDAVDTAVSTQSSLHGEAAAHSGGVKCQALLIEEFADCGTLQQLAAAWDTATEADMLALLLLLRDAARGLVALHGGSIVHGDLNARNVLLSSDPQAPYIGIRAQLADLGLARVIKHDETHRTTKTVGTMSHCAPELLQHGRISVAADVYSYGIMMWEAYTSRLAFSKLHYGQFFEAIVLHKLRPVVPPATPADYRLLMEQCWSGDAASRPSAKRLLACLDLMIQERERRLQRGSGSGSGRGGRGPAAAAPAAAAGATWPLHAAAAGGQAAGLLAGGLAMRRPTVGAAWQRPGPADGEAQMVRRSMSAGGQAWRQLHPLVVPDAAPPPQRQEGDPESWSWVI